MLLVVNYHYFSQGQSSGNGVHPMSVDVFAAQLDELGRGFEFVGLDQLLGALEGERSLPARSCLITFDDGLRSQFELALPVLEAREVPVIFFVPGRPLDEPHVLPVHKIHQLREVMSDGNLLAALREELARRGIPEGRVDPAEASAAYRYDTEEAAMLKYLLNVVLGPARPDLLDPIFSSRFDETEFAQRLYLTPEQVRELGRRDELGAHGYSHQPLARMSHAAARADLLRGAAVLERIAGARPRALSYPYGTSAAVDEAVAREAAAAGFATGFTLERAFNRTLEHPLLFARLDANDAPGGRAPLFTLDGDSIALGDGMTEARRRYLAEVA